MSTACWRDKLPAGRELSHERKHRSAFSCGHGVVVVVKLVRRKALFAKRLLLCKANVPGQYAFPGTNGKDVATDSARQIRPSFRVNLVPKLY